MIQRIQSLYLLIAALLLSACLFMPLWHIHYGPGLKYTFDAFSVWATDPLSSNPIHGESTAYIGIALILSILLSFSIILLFKNRSLQTKLGILNACLIFVIWALMYWKGSMLNKHVIGNFSIAFYFPALAIILNLLAVRSIKKDDELVKSADRIR